MASHSKETRKDPKKPRRCLLVDTNDFTALQQSNNWQSYSVLRNGHAPGRAEARSYPNGWVDASLHILNQIKSMALFSYVKRPTSKQSLQIELVDTSTTNLVNSTEQWKFTATNGNLDCPVPLRLRRSEDPTTKKLGCSGTCWHLQVESEGDFFSVFWPGFSLLLSKPTSLGG